MKEGKIVKALSGFYYVLSKDGLYQCRGRGLFRKDKINPLVGDKVVFQADNKQEGYITELGERKNELVRPPIANVDQAVLVFSIVEPDFSHRLLNSFLVSVESEQIKPLICLTKLDLAKQEEIAEIQQYKQYYEEVGYEVLLVSNKTKEGLDEIRERLMDVTTVFAGQSGVGKSSLLNALDPELTIKTADISKHLGRGRHTTRHVELIKIGSGLVADTPGFSSIEFTEIEAEDLDKYFLEFYRASSQCRFRGCLHLQEPACAVKSAVEEGRIAKYRYDDYLHFMQEIKDRKPRY